MLHWSVLLLMGVGVAEIGDAKAATMARKIADEKRIVSKDTIWDQNISEGLVGRHLAFIR